MKICTKCKIARSLDQFEKNSRAKDGLNYHCKECRREAARARYKKNPKPHVERNRKYREGNPDKIRCLKFRTVFGITLEEYERMSATQNNLCAICKLPETSLNNQKVGGVRRLAVDHNHKTGQVRELLCSHCNKALGSAREDIKILSRMIEYIKKHKKE